MDNNFLDGMAENLKNQLDGVQKVFNEQFDSFPKDIQEKVKGPHIELNKAIIAAKSGDIEAIYKMSK